MEPLEGEWPDARRVVIVEFPTLDDARRWYRSPEYAEALAIGERGAFKRSFMLVEGVAPVT